MTYNSIEEIEAAYPEPENETKAERTKRLRNMNQAKKRLITRQQKASQVAGGSSTATPQITTPSQPEVEEEEEETDPDVPSRKRTKTTHLETEQETEQHISSRTRSRTTVSATLRKQKSRTAQIQPQIEIEEDTEQGTSSRKRSKTTASATARKQKSRAAQTVEQRKSEREQDKIRKQLKYIMRREQLKEQYLNIGCCTIDDYLESRVEGDDIENGRHMFGRMDNICRQYHALK